MAHSNQLNFLEHSEEPYNKYRYLHLIPNLQLTSAGRTGTANGPQIALGPHFAQVCSIYSSLQVFLCLSLSTSLSLQVFLYPSLALLLPLSLSLLSSWMHAF